MNPKISYKVETWTVSKIINKWNNKELIVPTYQRNKVWKKEQKIKLHDSIKKNYPIGSLLLYQTNNNLEEKYKIIDGLQRISTIVEFSVASYRYFEFTKMPDWENLKQKIIEKDLFSKSEFNNFIVALEKFVQKKGFKLLESSFQFLDFIELMKNTEEYEHFFKDNNQGKGEMEKIAEITRLLGQPIQRTLINEELKNVEIPIIICSGDENEMADLFVALNTNGKPLDKYEVTAAAWDSFNLDFSNEKENLSANQQILLKQIIDKVYKKYYTFDDQSFIKEDDTLLTSDANIEEVQNGKLNLFEIIFGFSKVMVEDFKLLFGYEKSKEDNESVDTIFDIINYCLSYSEKLSNLNKTLEKTFKNEKETFYIMSFLMQIYNSAKFVDDKLKKARYLTYRVNEKTGNVNNVWHQGTIATLMVIDVYNTNFVQENYEDNKYKKINLKEERLNSDLYPFTDLLKYYLKMLINPIDSATTSKIEEFNRKLGSWNSPFDNSEWNQIISDAFNSSRSKSSNNIKRTPYKTVDVLLLTLLSSESYNYQQLTSNEIHLDHIFPIKWIANIYNGLDKNAPKIAFNSILNLVPIPKTINSIKSDKLYTDLEVIQKIINDKQIQQIFNISNQKQYELYLESKIDCAFSQINVPFENSNKNLEKFLEIFEQVSEIREENIKRKLINLLSNKLN